MELSPRSLLKGAQKMLHEGESLAPPTSKNDGTTTTDSRDAIKGFMKDSSHDQSGKGGPPLASGSAPLMGPPPIGGPPPMGMAMMGSGGTANYYSAAIHKPATAKPAPIQMMAIGKGFHSPTALPAAATTTSPSPPSTTRADDPAAIGTTVAASVNENETSTMSPRMSTGFHSFQASSGSTVSASTASSAGAAASSPFAAGDHANLKSMGASGGSFPAAAIETNSKSPRGLIPMTHSGTRNPTTPSAIPMLWPTGNKGARMGQPHGGQRSLEPFGSSMATVDSEPDASTNTSSSAKFSQPQLPQKESTNQQPLQLLQAPHHQQQQPQQQQQPPHSRPQLQQQEQQQQQQPQQQQQQQQHHHQQQQQQPPSVGKGGSGSSQTPTKAGAATPKKVGRRKVNPGARSTFEWFLILLNVFLSLGIMCTVVGVAHMAQAVPTTMESVSLITNIGRLSTHVMFAGRTLLFEKEIFRSLGSSTSAFEGFGAVFRAFREMFAKAGFAQQLSDMWGEITMAMNLVFPPKK